MKHKRMYAVGSVPQAAFLTRKYAQNFSHQLKYANICKTLQFIHGRSKRLEVT